MMVMYILDKHICKDKSSTVRVHWELNPTADDDDEQKEQLEVKKCNRNVERTLG